MQTIFQDICERYLEWKFFFLKKRFSLHYQILVYVYDNEQLTNKILSCSSLKPIGSVLSSSLQCCLYNVTLFPKNDDSCANNK